MNSLLIDKHVKYFTLCLNMLSLKHQDQDNNKLSLICFCLEGLELLGGLKFSPTEINQFSDSIYGSYALKNGFRSTMNSAGVYDSPTIASTFFALQNLLLLRSPINEKVDRYEVMRFLSQCQYKSGSQNGSFSPTLSIDNTPFGDLDLRICYMAAGIRKMLKYDEIPLLQRQYDIDIPALTSYILDRLNPSGGFSCVPLSESHLGYTYCAIATLKLIGFEFSTLNLEPTVNWILHRQVNYPEVVYEDEDVNHDGYGGFNGRENKLADSCYSWWALASLDILGYLKLANLDQNVQFLLRNQEHRIGGISKTFDSSPDPYHTFLSVASLALVREAAEFDGNQQLAPVDAELSIPQHLRQFMDLLAWAQT